MTRFKAFWLGFREWASDMGLTWENDPGHPLSRAYDHGRNWGRWLHGLED